MLRSLANVKTILELSNYEIEDFIGASSYSNVYKAFDKKTGSNCVFKFTSLLDKDVSDSIYTLDLMRSCDVPNIIKNYGYFYFKKYDDIPEYLREKFISYIHQDSDFYIIVNEYMPNGNLYDYILHKKKKNESIDPMFRYKIIFGIASIMKKLHSLHLFHRDLKTSHIFFDENYEPKISLCHTSKFLISEDEDQTPMIGTPLFVAPEVINGSNYGLKADVYSFSIILLNLFTNNIEFSDGSRLTSYNIYSKISSGVRYKKPENIPEIYWNLIQKCWKQDEKERFSFEDVVDCLIKDEIIFIKFSKKEDIDSLHEYQNRYEANGINNVFYKYSLQVLRH